MGIIDMFPRWMQRTYFNTMRPLIFKRYKYLKNIIRGNKCKKIMEY